MRLARMVLLAVVAGTALWWASAGRQPVSAVQRPPQRLPDAKLYRLDDENRTLRQWQAGRAAVITLFVHGCPDCMPHVPALVELTRALSSDRRIALGSVVTEADLRKLRTFASTVGLRGDLLVDPGGLLMSTARVTSLTTLVVDRDRVIRYRGAPDAGAVGAVLDAL